MISTPVYIPFLCPPSLCRTEPCIFSVKQLPAVNVFISSTKSSFVYHRIFWCLRITAIWLSFDKYLPNCTGQNDSKIFILTSSQASDTYLHLSSSCSTGAHVSKTEQRCVVCLSLYGPTIVFISHTGSLRTHLYSSLPHPAYPSHYEVLPNPCPKHLSNTPPLFNLFPHRI